MGSTALLSVCEGWGRKKGFCLPGAAAAADGAISRVKMCDKRRSSLIRSFKALHCPCAYCVEMGRFCYIGNFETVFLNGGDLLGGFCFVCFGRVCQSVRFLPTYWLASSQSHWEKLKDWSTGSSGCHNHSTLGSGSRIGPTLVRRENMCIIDNGEGSGGSRRRRRRGPYGRVYAFRFGRGEGKNV